MNSRDKSVEQLSFSRKEARDSAQHPRLRSEHFLCSFSSWWGSPPSGAGPPGLPKAPFRNLSYPMASAPPLSVSRAPPASKSCLPACRARAGHLLCSPLGSESCQVISGMRVAFCRAACPVLLQGQSFMISESVYDLAAHQRLGLTDHQK